MNPSDLSRQAAERASRQALENGQRAMADSQRATEAADRANRQFNEFQRRSLDNARMQRDRGGGGSSLIGKVFRLLFVVFFVIVAFIVFTNGVIPR